jgi:hypothetical protein
MISVVGEVQALSFKEITIWVIRRSNYLVEPIRILILKIFIIFCIANLFVDVLGAIISCLIFATDSPFFMFCCRSYPS